MPKRDDAEDRCSGCNSRKYDTCKAKNRCSCEDGQDGSAHWVRFDDICPTCEDARCRGEHAPMAHDVALAEVLVESGRSGKGSIADEVLKASKKLKKKPVKQNPNISKSKTIKPPKAPAVPLADKPKPKPTSDPNLCDLCHERRGSVADGDVWACEQCVAGNIPKQDDICQACKKPECWGDCIKAVAPQLAEAREKKAAAEAEAAKQVEDGFKKLPEGPPSQAEW